MAGTSNPDLKRHVNDEETPHVNEKSREEPKKEPKPMKIFHLPGRQPKAELIP